MQSEKKHANKEKPGRIKAKILMELLFPSTDPLELASKEKPVLKDDIKNRLCLTKENLRFHLYDPRSGLISQGIVRERQRKLWIEFKDSHAVEKAVEYLASFDKFRVAIERYFANAFLSVYGDVFQATEYEISRLSEEMEAQYNDFRFRSIRDMGEGKRPSLNQKDVEMAMELLKIRRGDVSIGFKFIYYTFALSLNMSFDRFPVEKLSIYNLTMGSLTNSHIYHLADPFLTLKSGGMEKVIKAIKLRILWDERVSHAGFDVEHSFPSFKEVPDAERLMFRYLVIYEGTLKNASISELQRNEIRLAGAIDGIDLSQGVVTPQEIITVQWDDNRFYYHFAGNTHMEPATEQQKEKRNKKPGDKINGKGKNAV